MKDQVKKAVDQYLKEHVKPCPRCDGDGTLLDFMQNDVKCYVCSGRGVANFDELERFGYRKGKSE